MLIIQLKRKYTEILLMISKSTRLNMVNAQWNEEKEMLEHSGWSGGISERYWAGSKS